MAGLPGFDTGFSLAAFRVFKVEDIVLEYVKSPVPMKLGKMATVSSLLDGTPHIVRVQNPTLFTIMKMNFNVFFPLKASYIKNDVEYAGLNTFLEFVKRYAGTTVFFTDSLPILRPRLYGMISTSKFTVTHSTKEFTCGEHRGGIYSLTFEFMAKI